MKSWSGVAAIVAAFVAGALALVLGSAALWVVAGVLLAGGLVLEGQAGWGADETSSQHPLRALRSGARR